MARPFGAYEALARLASGGAANIFLARQAADNGVSELCALKTLLPERVTDHEFVEMFLDEARLAAQLRHPSCVAIYDYGKEGGTYYIAMEYVSGETLWNLLTTVPETRTPLPPMLVASIIAAACDGLHHAHELKDPDGHPFNLVHRDISPQNIMISYEGKTKVLDFGIAKAETGRQATATGIVKGKFGYMSPEQITGGAVDRRSDVYSLGIVLFECLAARRLFRSDSPEEVARSMLDKKGLRLRELAPELDPALEAICNKALARHPSNRFQSAEEMAKAIRELFAARGFREGSAAVARLVEERFGPRIAERKRVLEQARRGSEGDEELLRVLGARPAMDIDLFPTHNAETAQELEAIGGAFPSGGKLPAPIELRGPASPLVSDESGSGETRVEGEATVLEGVEPNVPVVQPRHVTTPDLPTASPRKSGAKRDGRSPLPSAELVRDPPSGGAPSAGAFGLVAMPPKLVDQPPSEIGAAAVHPELVGQVSELRPREARSDTPKPAVPVPTSPPPVPQVEPVAPRRAPRARQPAPVEGGYPLNAVVSAFVFGIALGLAVGVMLALFLRG